MLAFIQRVLHDLVTQAPHTLFVHFPIALLTAALLFIILALLFKNDILERAAFLNTALAVVSIVVCAIVGIRDNAVFYAGQAANHIAKIILASTLFVITLVMVLVRWRNPNLLHSRGNWLYVTGFIVSFAIVSVLGFLGGVIFYGF